MDFFRNDETPMTQSSTAYSVVSAICHYSPFYITSTSTYLKNYERNFTPDHLADFGEFIQPGATSAQGPVLY